MASVVLLGGALAEEASPEHYVAMRSYLIGDGPRFVLAAQQANDERSNPLEGCDGVTYYLRAEDAGAVQDAMTAGDTVQLHVGGPGIAANNAAIVCLFQAAQ